MLLCMLLKEFKRANIPNCYHNLSNYHTWFLQCHNTWQEYTKENLYNN